MKNIYILPSFLCLALIACQTTKDRASMDELAVGKDKIAYRFANFPIYGWQSITNTDDTAIHVYIEGDGYAYISRTRPSSNPTPKTPVASKLAQMDDMTSHIVYLGRPCHYATAQDLQSQCDRKYWTTHRFASDVIQAYDEILDDIALQNPGAQIHLIGFSGGANIAGLLSVKRSDIKSLRTVAGNVDNDYFTRFHKVSDMPYSLNMADYASQLATMPQMHFIAADDRFVPRDIYNNYQSRLPNTSCTQADVIRGTTHLKGWAERWRDLLRRTPFCQ